MHQAAMHICANNHQQQQERDSTECIRQACRPRQPNSEHAYRSYDLRSIDLPVLSQAVAASVVVVRSVACPSPANSEEHMLADKARQATGVRWSIQADCVSTACLERRRHFHIEELPLSRNQGDAFVGLQSVLRVTGKRKR
jgi:hypothetical protein